MSGCRCKVMGISSHRLPRKRGRPRGLANRLASGAGQLSDMAAGKAGSAIDILPFEPEQPRAHRANPLVHAELVATDPERVTNGQLG